MGSTDGRGANPLADLTDYELRHLIAHLAELGHGDDVHRLLRLEVVDGDRRLNAWFDRKRARGEFDAYLADVAVGWRVADEAGSDPGAVVLQAEYALFTASVNSLVGLMPISDLATHAASGSVEPSQAVALAERYADPRDRVGALVALASELDGVMQHRAGAGVLDSIPSLSNPLDRARAMARVAPHLSPELAPRALALARRFASAEEGSLLPTVAPALRSAELDVLLAEVRGRLRAASHRRRRHWLRGESNDERGSRLGDEELLAALLERLAELGEPERALELADELLLPEEDQLELRYAQAAAGILRHLPLEAARQLATRLEDLAQGDGSPSSIWRSAWAQRLMRAGEGDLAIAVVSAISDENARFRFVSAAELLDEAPHANDRLRLVAMMVAALRLPDGRGADLDEGARHIAAALRKDDLRTRMQMGARLAKAPKLLAAVMSSEARSEAMDPIGPTLGGSSGEGALSALTGATALAVGRRLRPLWARGRDRRHHDEHRAESDAVRAAGVELTAPAREPVSSTHAETWSPTTVDPTWDWSAIDRRAVGDGASRPDLDALFAALEEAGRLPEVRGVGVGESLWGAAMEEAGRAPVFRERPRARAQVDVICRIAEAGAPNAALEAVTDVDDAFWRGLALSRISPRLPASLLDSALEAARALPPHHATGNEEDSRTAALYVLARVLVGHGRAADASAVADELTHAPARRATRVALVRKLVDLRVPELVTIWQRALHSLAHEPRIEVVREVATLAPVLAGLAGPTAGQELADRIVRVMTWWPLEDIVGASP
jgi:hypothetical protein